MSHDLKKNKLLKKILGALGIKVFPKETIKLSDLLSLHLSIVVI